jgi:CHAD domain-containing protein
MKLEPIVEEFFTTGGEAASSDDGAVLHAFRIATKHLRYTIEILDPKDADVWLDKLKTVQQELGDMNDCFIAERYLRALPSLSAQARPLPKLLHAEAHSHIAKFQATWQRHFGDENHQAWLDWARKVDH